MGCLIAWVFVMIEHELKALNAPRNVVDAGRLIDQRTTAKMSPPRDVVQLVTQWVSRNMGNNRYGK